MTNAGSGSRTIVLLASVALLAVGGPALADVGDFGGYETDIPIVVPAYHGLEPRIALVYDSHAGNGLLGVGWRLHAGSAIVRVSARHGAPRFDATDVYLLDGGELVPCTPSSPSPSCETAASAIAAGVAPSTAVFYSTKVESYQRIAFDAPSGKWWVWGTLGTKATYVTVNGGQTFYLSSVEDTHGNRVDYGAWCDGLYDCYLERITYAGTTTAAGAEIRFFFELRPDPIESGTGAGLRYTRHRLKSVSVKMAGQLARAYSLGYATSAATDASVLSSFQQFGRDATVDGAGTITAGAMPPLPAMTFETASMGASSGTWEYPFITAQPNLPTINPAPGAPSYPSHFNGLALTVPSCAYDTNVGDEVCRAYGSLTGDWNGDGRSDALAWGVKASCMRWTLEAVLTQPSGVGGIVATSAPTGITRASSKCTAGAWAADLNGDTKDDVLLYVSRKLQAFYSDGDGGFTPAPTSMSRELNISHCDIGDVNADGRQDLVCSDDTSPGLRLVTMRTGVGGSFAVTAELLGALGISAMVSHRLVLADVDGDGDSDVVLANKTNGTWTLVTGLSNGDGTWAWETQATSWPYGPNEVDVLFAGDFNGDGKQDVLLDRAFASGAADDIHVGLAAKGAILGRFVLVHPSTPWARAVFVADVNGDGKDDLVRKGSLTAAFANGTGSFDPPPAGTSVNCESVHVADLNGDGKADYLCVEDDLGGTLTFRDRVTPNSGVNVHRWTPSDVDGDGVSEFVYLHHRNPGYEVYTIFPATNTRTSQTIAPSGSVPGLDNPDAARWLPIDVGSASGAPDGRADLVFVDKVAGTLGVYTLLSNGNGTWQVRYDTPWKTSAGTVVGYGAEDVQHWGPADVNGDGRADLVHTYFLRPGVRVEYLLSNGNGTWVHGAHDYFTATTTTPPLDALSVPTVQDFRLLDVDADGLTDLVHLEYVGSRAVGTRVRTLLSNGNGTFTPRQWSATVPFLVDSRRWRPMDANGDGMADLVHIGYTRNGVVTCLDTELLVSHGNGTWTWRRTYWACHIASATDERGLLEDPRFVRLMDVNGDGRTDLLHVSDYWDASMTRKTAVVLFENSPLRHGSWVKTVQKNLGFQLYANDPWAWQAWLSPWTGTPGLSYAHPQHLYAMQWRATSDRMTRLSNGLGASTRVSYGLLIGRRSYLPSGMIPTVTDTVEVSDGANTPPVTERTTYDYDRAGWSDRERRILGYGVRIAKNGGRGILATYRLSDECGAQLEWSEERQASGDTLGALFRATHFSYVATGPNAPYTCLVAQEERREYELATSYRATRRNYSYDGYGNVIRLFEEGNLGNVGDDRWTESTVFPNKARYLVGLPAYTIVGGMVDVRGLWQLALLSSTLREYDGNTTYAAPPGALGELRRSKEWNSQSGTYLTTELQYDAAGNVTRTTDPVGIWRSTTYDPTYGLFPIRECNALFCTNRTWNLVLGLPATSVDENSQTTKWSYDAYGRLERTDRPDASFTRVQYLSFGVSTGAISGRQRVRSEESDGSPGDGVLWSEAYFDGLGRTYQTVSEGGITRNIEFADASMRPARVTEPYALGQTAAWSRYHYDDLRRPVLIERPDNSTVQTLYGIGTVTTIDEMGQDEIRHLDQYGRVTRVEEKNQPCPTCARKSQFTDYAYDGLDRLISIVDNAKHTTSLAWNSLGRQIKACDPDRGCQTYTFRDNGQLETSTDAKGQLTRWTYDSIGRQIQKEEVGPMGAVTRTVTWAYDRDPATKVTQGSSLGRMVRENDAGAIPGSKPLGSKTLWYDTMGRVTRSRQCVYAVCAELGYGFDPAGRLATIDYPDAARLVSPTSERVTYAYDAAGRLTSASGYVTSLTYDDRAQLTQANYANGVRMENQYDPSRGWLDATDVWDSGGNMLFRAIYGHDSVARIRRLQTWNPIPVSTKFDYDELGRLREVMSTDPARNQSFMYDAVGNTTYNSKLGDYHYNDPAHVHAVTRTDNGDQYAYDANGNMVRGRDLVLKWTQDDMPASILNKTTGKSAVMAYDPAGRLVKRTMNGIGTTYSFGPLVEREPGGGWIKYYYAGDQLIAQRDPANGATWYTQDHLHSTRVMTNDHGKAVNRYEYMAYGEKVTASESVPTDWTTFDGKDDDDLSGLVYMNSRFYDPKLGRFLSTDNLIPAIFRPQSLNRYSYVENDPVNFWDPSGHMPMRVELKKDIDTRSRAAFASVWNPCFQCEIPSAWVRSNGGASSFPEAKRNAQGEWVFRRVGDEWSIMSISKLPVTPPPLISVQEASPHPDGPPSSPEEWAPFPGTDDTAKPQDEPSTFAPRHSAEPGTVGLQWPGPLYKGHFAEMGFQAAMAGFTVTAKTGGPHNTGSLHFQGNAIDLSVAGKTNVEINDFIGFMTSQGYQVRDERVRPRGQAVWTGPHLHIERR